MSVNWKAFWSVLLVSCCAISTTNAQQTVFLDFSGTSGSIVYNPSDQAFILGLMDNQYAAFDFDFTLIQPISGPFSTITFNAGPTGGLAEHVDFGNTDKDDTATVNVNGLGLGSQAGINIASANIGSHELGHLQGLRHGDSFGPIGAGVHSPPGKFPYFPNYPGPEGAVETNDHTMASPASTGQSIASVTTPSFFSERSAIKLAFNESGSFISEVAGSKDTLLTAQALSLGHLIVPNTILSGQNAGAGAAFSVDAIAVSGALAAPGEFDLFSFTGLAGDLMNIELMSAVSDWKTDFFDVNTQLSVLDSSGDLIPYYTGTAFNDDEFESSDSILIDLFLPSDGNFFVRVDRSPLTPGDTGNYELFLTRFNGAVPEPGAAFLIGIGLSGLVARRRVRRIS